MRTVWTAKPESVKAALEQVKRQGSWTAGAMGVRGSKAVRDRAKAAASRAGTNKQASE